MTLKTNELFTKEYAAPVVEMTGLEFQGILCSSDPQSNFIENMSFGDDFTGWN